MTNTIASKRDQSKTYYMSSLDDTWIEIDPERIRIVNEGRNAFVVRVDKGVTVNIRAYQLRFPTA